MSQQPVASRDVNDATAAKETPDSPRGLPCFEELFSWQAPCVAHGAGEPMKERVVREAAEIVVGQSSAGRERERHASSIAAIATRGHDARRLRSAPAPLHAEAR